MRGIPIDPESGGRGQAEHVQTRVPGADARRIAALVIRSRKNRAEVLRGLIGMALDRLEAEQTAPP